MGKTYRKWSPLNKVGSENRPRTNGRGEELNDCILPVKWATQKRDKSTVSQGDKWTRANKRVDLKKKRQAAKQELRVIS